MKQSLEFYHGLLGLRVVRDKRRSGEAYDQLTGISNVLLRVVLLEDGSSGSLLELVQYLDPRAADRVPRDDEIGSSNLCLVVDDLDELHRKLSDAGVASRSSPVDFVQDGRSVGRIVTVFDPDRISVVLFEKLR
jgi:catechol 2,3-dioxygenase-like lactoylglutathione lyase family enzyme